MDKLTVNASELHDRLWLVTTKLPQDYEPYGQVERGYLPDCSSGCRYFVRLGGDVGLDWGVCSNPQSHRRGLLTFEHMGCPQCQPKLVKEEDGA
jgi:hypothetical protein